MELLNLILLTLVFSETDNEFNKIHQLLKSFDKPLFPPYIFSKDLIITKIFAIISLTTICTTSKFKWDLPLTSTHAQSSHIP